MSMTMQTEKVEFCSASSTLKLRAEGAPKKLRSVLLVPEFVDPLPDQISQGRLYISVIAGVAVHACPCCCGLKVVTPISPTAWRITFDFETVSLHPSVKNSSCGANYAVNRSSIVWLDAKSVRFLSLIAYIRSNAMRPEISAATAARDMGLSVRYVHKLFEREGVTFSRYVSEIRIDWVAGILASKTKNERVADLMLRSGYRDSSAFYRDFKRRFGCTPGTFR